MTLAAAAMSQIPRALWALTARSAAFIRRGDPRREPLLFRTRNFMSRLVMKFGGTSVANIERIRNVARHVKREVEAGHEVAVVVSAMAGKTNELVAWVQEAAPLYDPAEYDAVVASGELVTAGLLAIVLKDMGLDARSWQGWQIPLHDRRCAWLGAHRRHRRRQASSPASRKGQIAVVAGFQGVHAGNRARHHARARRLRHFRRGARGGA